MISLFTGLLIGSLFTAMFVPYLIVYLLYIVGLVKVFHKMGESGIKGFIPILNEYTVYKRVWNTNTFWIVLVLNIISSIANNYQGHPGFLLSFITGLLSILLVMFEFRKCFFLSYAFGHGMLFTMGLFFFPFIFVPILGYDQSYYHGNPNGDYFIN